ncbi:hypothetical protein DPMN_082991 [Dreissena polymorpha]|uniref:Uncharacterized protein n=1 Tax=Dreissena polymorpha TaxID=45954 RepID=A0A9D4BHA3_DREPO|nr:hypothetical protein DPMN_082991 [Dreissena polymorpha]
MVLCCGWKPENWRKPYLFGMVTTIQTHMLPRTGIEPGLPRCITAIAGKSKRSFPSQRLHYTWSGVCFSSPS